MFKVAIIGGKGTDNYDFFKERCAFFLRDKAKSGEGIMIYTTGDDFVDQFARHYGINVRFFFTDWKKYGKDALKYRNEEMLKDCNAIIRFEDGLKDTDMIFEMAKNRGIPSRKVKGI